MIFQVLASLDLSAEEAGICWSHIGRHHADLTSRLGRRISLQTTICDYFCTIYQSLKNPKVVEINVYEKTVKASRYDTLTGLMNRYSMDELLEREVARARRYDKELSVLFLDLDDFKSINDKYGHQAGDHVLKSVADVLTHEKRLEDIAARYGGEELVLILPETGKLNTMVLGERIRKAVEKLDLEMDGNRYRITLSGGVSTFPMNADNAVDLIRCADKALYLAKGAGKNNIAFYTQDKRRYLRVDYEKDIKINRLNVDVTVAETVAGKNLSVGGILFEYPEVIDLGTSLQIQLPGFGGDSLYLIGKVVRVEQFDKNRFDIGVSISLMEMDRAVKREISDWLRVKRAQP